MAKLIPAVLDLESYWATDHTLAKMNPVVYCTHPETEIISIAYKIGDDQTFCISGEGNVKEWAKSVDWSDKLVIAHNNSGFDSMILRWRLGIKPAMWGCTLAMAKPIHNLTIGNSLAKLVAHYELGVKDKTALSQTKGRHLKDFTFDERAAMEEYNKADVDQCYGLFKQLLPLTPKQEMKLIDMTIRMLVEPKFRIDVPLLEQTLATEKTRKQAVLMKLAHTLGADVEDEAQAAEFVRSEVASAPKFAALLTSMGVPIPMKQSPSDAEKQIPALAKTDVELQALLEHPNGTVRLLAATRLDVKSTILESRVEAFLEVARVTGGRMPIALNYYEAVTGRWGGHKSFKLNQQNLPRVSGKPSDALRNCLIAPPGHKIVVADLSGIELRVNHFLWQVPYSTALYQADPEKTDLYKSLASQVFGVAYDDVTKAQRQAAKGMHLGCQFGLGSAAKYVSAAKQLAGVDVADDEAEAHIKAYRKAHPEIVQGWKSCDKALPAIYQGARHDIDPAGLCYTSAEGIHTPVGMIRYPALRKEMNSWGREEWCYGEGRNKTNIYGGKICNNIVQHLARNVVAHNALEIKRLTGLYPCHTVHDELIYVVPEADAQAHLDLVQSVMRTPPAWWPELVTWSEGDIADSYGAAK